MEWDVAKPPTKAERDEIRQKQEQYMQELKEAMRLAWAMNDTAMGYEPDEPTKPKGRKKNVY